MARRRRRPATSDVFLAFFVCMHLLFSCVSADTFADDATAMVALSLAIGGASLGWKGSDPCGSNWAHVGCNGNRVTSVELPNAGLSGTLPASVSKLTKLTTLSLQNNKLAGPIPLLSGLSSLQTLFLDNNNFSSLPADAFSGLTGLQTVRLDYNPLAPWQIPDLSNSTGLQSFTGSKANAVGAIPDFFASLPNLAQLKLSYNSLIGSLPPSFAKSSIQTLWLNNQQGEKLSGSIAVLAQMPELSQVWLHSNAFSGPIPNLSSCTSLFDLQLRDNGFTGIVPSSLTSLNSLQNVSLGNNQLQGPLPVFLKSVKTVDLGGTNSFCLSTPGPCDERISILLDIASNLNYPSTLAMAWKGNDPCSGWSYVTCNLQGMITVLNLADLHLVGSISPAIANLTGLRTLLLNNNSLTGTVPADLSRLQNLQTIDVSNNNLTGTLPNFNRNLTVKFSGNPFLGSSNSSGGRSGSGGGRTGPDSPNSSEDSSSRGSSSSLLTRIGIGVGISLVAMVIFGLVFRYLRKLKGPKLERVLSHPPASDTDHIKLGILNGNGHIASEQQSMCSSGPGSLGDQGSMVISIQVLQQVTNNFSESNVIGKGGFGVVYKGELHDGTKIAVKRMEGTVAGSKGMNEFMAEIAVLTKVRHRHLVALLGYCIDGNERLLVYEYMPQGTLGQHLFEGPEKGFSYLNWKARLTIALDVARGVEYLHSLAQKSFIHRDLKPSNILLGDNMRAKVSDFGLVKLAPEGKYSVETRLAGTFGYLAPEYAATGRVTTKVDVYAFGVVLMEMITGRKALDESLPEESCHLVTWFRRMLISTRGDISKAIDSTINVDDEETFKSIRTVAELAGHCTVREPSQRPDMGHTVNILAPLVEQWRPCSRDEESSEGVNYDIPLSVALQRWQANEGTSMMTEAFYGGSTIAENTQSSIHSSSIPCFPDSVNSR